MQPQQRRFRQPHRAPTSGRGASDCVARTRTGLSYQRSLCQSDIQVQQLSAPLSVDSLALLVNQHLEREGDLARVSQDDIRAAITLAASPLFNAVIKQREL
jgi:hypothetical protein